MKTSFNQKQRARVRVQAFLISAPPYLHPLQPLTQIFQWMLLRPLIPLGSTRHQRPLLWFWSCCWSSMLSWSLLQVWTLVWTSANSMRVTLISTLSSSHTIACSNSALTNCYSECSSTLPMAMKLTHRHSSRIGSHGIENSKKKRFRG